MSYILHKDEYGNIVGLDKNEPVLKHWKYKRKYRGPSGDWVYIYDDGSMSEKGETRTTEMAYGKGKKPDYVHETIVRTDPSQNKTTKSTHIGPDSKITETITYGRRHILKMNMQRRLSSLKKASGETLKRLFFGVSKKGASAKKLGKYAGRNITTRTEKHSVTEKFAPNPRSLSYNPVSKGVGQKLVPSIARPKERRRGTHVVRKR